jgi:hypothetical protein
VALGRTDVSEEPTAAFIRGNSEQHTLQLATGSCPPDEGGAGSLRNVRSYKSHTA